MPSETKQADTWSARLAKELTRDTKKTVTLTVLVIVAIVFGLRALNKQTPASAGAETLGEIDMFSGATESPSMFASTRRPRPASEIPLHVIPTDLTRDLFSFDATNFEAIEKPLPAPIEPTVATVDAPIIQPDVRAIVEQEAQSLTLQSTMASDRPVAIINGEVLTVGEKVEGFVVVSIATGHCVIEKQGVSVSLRMGQPKE